MGVERSSTVVSVVAMLVGVVEVLVDVDVLVEVEVLVDVEEVLRCRSYLLSGSYR
jgi:hypothetical protein